MSRAYGISDTPWDKPAGKKRKSDKNFLIRPMYHEKRSHVVEEISDDQEGKPSEAVSTQLTALRAQMNLSEDGLEIVEATSSIAMPQELRKTTRKRLSEDNFAEVMMAKERKMFMHLMEQESITVDASQRTTPESDFSSTAVVPTAPSPHLFTRAIFDGIRESSLLVVDAEFKEALGNWGKYAVRLFLADQFQPNGPAYAFSDEKEAKECSREFWKSAKIKISARGKLILRDFSLGRELIPLPVFDITNDVNKRVADPGFKYISTNSLDNFEQTLKKEDFTLCCDCTDGCGLLCECVLNSIGAGSAFAYKNFILVRDQNFWNSAVFACGPECHCRGECSNAAPIPAQEAPLELYRENTNMGFAVRATADIMPGEVVFEFAGDVLDGGEVNENYSWCIFDRVDRNQDDGYVRIIDKVFNGKAVLPLLGSNGSGYQIHIDPYKKGNMGRFASHSEYPNTLPIRMFQNDLRPEMTKLMFIASRPIPAGAQVFADYGAGYNGFESCLCGGMGCGKAGDFLRVANEYSATKILVNQLYKHIFRYNMTFKGPDVKSIDEERILRTKLRALRSLPKLNPQRIIREVDELMKEREDILNGTIEPASPSNFDEFLTDDESRNSGSVEPED